MNFFYGEKMKYCHKFYFVVKSDMLPHIYFVGKLFIFAITLNFLAKNNCLRTYNYKLVTNIFYPKKSFTTKYFILITN